MNSTTYTDKRDERLSVCSAARMRLRPPLKSALIGNEIDAQRAAA
jgi:hypothetical protein